MAKGKRLGVGKLRLPIDYPEPPPDEHQPLITVKSCGWAYELKRLVYHYNPDVQSVRIDAEFPNGWAGNDYPIEYVVKVKLPETTSLRKVLLRAIVNYPSGVQDRCKGLADSKLGFRPTLIKRS